MIDQESLALSGKEWSAQKLQESYAMKAISTSKICMDSSGKNWLEVHSSCNHTEKN